MTFEEPLTLLYIEDNIADLRLFQSKLKRDPQNELTVEHAPTLREAALFLQKQHVDLVLLDLSLPDAHGLEGVRYMLHKFSRMPLVVLTGNTDKTTAVEAIKIGAQDYLVKGEFSNMLLFKVCRYAIQRAAINYQLKEAVHQVEELNQELTMVNAQLYQTVHALREEKKKVEAKNQQIHTLVNILMHDLKNPISAISSITNLLLEQSAKLNVPQIKFLNQIKSSSTAILDHILTLVDTLQTKKGQSLQLTLVSDNPFYTLNSAIDKYVIEAIQKNVILDIQYNKQLPKVMFDRRTLEKVMSTLMAFMISQSEANSRLTIKAEPRKEHFRILIENKFLHFSEAELAELMELPKSNESSENNLALVKQLVMAMKGEMGVEPTKNKKGSLFWFTLQYAVHSFSEN